MRNDYAKCFVVMAPLLEELCRVRKAREQLRRVPCAECGREVVVTPRVEQQMEAVEKLRRTLPPSLTHAVVILCDEDRQAALDDIGEGLWIDDTTV